MLKALFMKLRYWSYFTNSDGISRFADLQMSSVIKVGHPESQVAEGPDSR